MSNRLTEQQYGDLYRAFTKLYQEGFGRLVIQNKLGIGRSSYYRLREELLWLLRKQDQIKRIMTGSTPSE